MELAALSLFSQKSFETENEIVIKINVIRSCHVSEEWLSFLLDDTRVLSLEVFMLDKKPNQVYTFGNSLVRFDCLRRIFNSLLRLPHLLRGSDSLILDVEHQRC